MVSFAYNKRRERDPGLGEGLQHSGSFFFIFIIINNIFAVFGLLWILLEKNSVFSRTSFVQAEQWQMKRAPKK